MAWTRAFETELEDALYYPKCRMMYWRASQRFWPTASCSHLQKCLLGSSTTIWTGNTIVTSPVTLRKICCSKNSMGHGSGAGESACKAKVAEFLYP